MDKSDGLRFSVSEYSQEEQQDIVDVLKPFIGFIVEKSPEEYASYLKDKGGTVISLEELAKHVAREIRILADCSLSVAVCKNPFLSVQKNMRDLLDLS